MTTVTHSMSFGGVDRCPLTDCRMGWIYDINTNDIIWGMQKFGLATEGKMRELKTICSVLAQFSQSTPTLGDLEGYLGGTNIFPGCTLVGRNQETIAQLLMSFRVVSSLCRASLGRLVRVTDFAF